ncbi:acetylglutamate kinase [Wenzhouxiangella sp. XN24]|uniref:acetylglutamate kinase n=1 Tax=Wenzhouxiangella sp. XN24 TaxID=2713569 RepID=UPI0013EB74BF|nr:acetylglutamate kinase [Wenzhouxiangella sp. XN24]NGX17308.1 acetylglutamate kinase [Wenzhouxiangella sp. XN24]
MSNLLDGHGERAIAVTALKAAVPYIRMFKRKVFVIKAGGAVFSDEESTRELIEQLGILYEVGIHVVLVHGGGPQSTALAKALDVPAQFVEGRRVTDERSLQVATMVLNGIINTRVLAICRDIGLPAIGMSGVDAGLIKAHRRPPVALEGDGGGTVDYGFVGDIDDVDSGVLQRQIEAGFLPIISPLSADEDGILLNINADTVAAAIAVALKAEKLILLTGAPGILDDVADQSSLVSYLDLADLERMRAEGRLDAGMKPKADAIKFAVRGGVPRVHVISWQVPDSLLLEVFTNEGTGTLVVQDTGTLTPEEQAAAEDED